MEWKKRSGEKQSCWRSEIWSRYTAQRAAKACARWTESTVTNFTPDDLDAMRAQYGESVLGVYDYFSSAFGPTNIGNGGARPISYYSDYWIDGFAQVDAEDTFWEERLLTDTDLSELGTDGIIISSYMFDCIRYYKLYENAPYRKEYELNDYDDVVGKPLKFNARDGTNVTLTIRGVFRADLPAEYEPLKDYSLNTYNPEMRALASRLDVEMEYGIYNLALVSDSFYEANYEHFISGNGLHALNYTIPAHRLGRDLLFYNSDTFHTFLSSARYFNEYPLQDYVMDEHVVRLDGKAAGAPLGSGEVIVPFDLLADKLEPMATTFLATLDTAQAALWAQRLLTGQALLSDGRFSVPDATPEDYAAALQTVNELIDACSGTAYAFDAQIGMSFDSPAGEELPELTIVGYYYGEYNYCNSSFFVCAQDFDELYATSRQGEVTNREYSVGTTRYRQPDDALYKFIIVPTPSSNGALRTLLRGEETVNADDSFYMVRSVVSNELDAVESVMEILELAFLLAGILMAVFAMLLLYNFISVSISYKKKEIGILRAVGARGADVFKIFYCESAIIALVCYVLALIGCFVLCAVLNSIIMESVSITLLVFGPLSWLVMLVIAVFTSALATFLPVRNYTKRKPIESIRAI